METAGIQHGIDLGGVGDAIEAQRTTSGCTYRIARS